jgi:hypothetical protein
MESEDSGCKGHSESSLDSTSGQVLFRETEAPNSPAVDRWDDGGSIKYPEPPIKNSDNQAQKLGPDVEVTTSLENPGDARDLS